MKFGELIKRARNQRGLSLSQLSAKSGIARMTIHNYEKGSEPTIGKADALLRALDLTVTIGMNGGDTDTKSD